MPAVRLHAFVQQRRQQRFADQFPRQADAFVKPCQVWRGVGVDGGARAFQPRADHGKRAALAVRPGDVDNRGNPPFGVAKCGQQPFDAPQGQVDDLWVQRQHPVEDDVGTAGHACAPSGWASGVGAGSSGAGRSPLIAGGSAISIRIRLTSSSFIALR